MNETTLKPGPWLKAIGPDTEVISIHWTPKGQDVDEFEKNVAFIAGVCSAQDVHLIHGFMTREMVEEKGFPQTINDALDRWFPGHESVWKDGVLNRNLLSCGQDVAFVIGELKEGVLEEYKMLKQHQIQVLFLRETSCCEGGLPEWEDDMHPGVFVDPD